MKPEKFRLSLSLDEEGVVRVVDCSHESVEVTPDELAKLVTALLKAFVGTSDDEEQVDVRLN